MNSISHPLQVGTFNTTGRKYQGHFSIWITNNLQENLIFLEDMLENPAPISNWVNGNLYIQTSETIGILSIPDELQVESWMTCFDPKINSKQPHTYLAERQNTCKAILPVHMPAKIKLFSTLMKDNSMFTSQSSGPCWCDCVWSWNSKANEYDDIFYKVQSVDLSFR